MKREGVTYLTSHSCEWEVESENALDVYLGMPSLHEQMRELSAAVERFQSLAGGLTDLSAVAGLQTEALAEQLSAITNQLDYSRIIGELMDAAAAVTLDAIPSAPVGVIEHILAAFEVDGMISAID